MEVILFLLIVALLFQTIEDDYAKALFIIVLIIIGATVASTLFITYLIQ